MILTTDRTESDFSSFKLLCRDRSQWKFELANLWEYVGCSRLSKFNIFDFSKISFATCGLTLSCWKMTPFPLAKISRFSWTQLSSHGKRQLIYQLVWAISTVEIFASFYTIVNRASSSLTFKLKSSWRNPSNHFWLSEERFFLSV